MIELTEEQRSAIDMGSVARVQENGREYVLLRADVYDRLTEDESDDSPWTADEMDRLRQESVALLDQFGKDK
jgi:hypothetical protein